MEIEIVAIHGPKNDPYWVILGMVQTKRRFDMHLTSMNDITDFWDALAEWWKGFNERRYEYN